MVPVGVVQLGCAMVDAGTAGAPGGGSTIAVPVELQPAACTVIVYVLGARPLNTVPGWKFVPSILYV